MKTTNPNLQRLNKSAGKQLKSIILPYPLDHQIRVLLDPARFKVLVAGRRWGKTVMGLIMVVTGHGPDVNGKSKYKGALQGGMIWWIAPTYGIASLIWRDLKDSLAGAWTDKREDERWILLPSGGSITVKSADNPDSLRGAGLDGVVFDECAYMDEAVWNEAIRPALADKQGWAVFISTPKVEDNKKIGDAWFRQIFERGLKKKNWSVWQRPTMDNPTIPAEEIEELRATMPELSFRQEIMAEFLNTSEGLFKREWFHYYQSDAENFYLKTESGIQQISRSVCTYFITMDLASKQQETHDYSVVGTWALTPNHKLLLLSIKRGKYTEVKNKENLWDAFNEFPVSFIGIEDTGYQFAFVQEMMLSKSIITRDDGSRLEIPPLPIHPLEVKNSNKYARALTISMHYKNGMVFHPDTSVVNAPWLPDYEYEMLQFPNKLVHDDQVDVASWAGIEMSTPRYTAGQVPILITSGGHR